MRNFLAVIIFEISNIYSRHIYCVHFLQKLLFKIYLLCDCLLTTFNVASCPHH